MASKLFLVVVFVFDLIAFAVAVAVAVAVEQGTKPLCHDAESLALLQFKESLTIHCKQFNDSSAHPKVFTWELESNDCCKWLGVECHENSGHVVSLDLSNICLLGSFNSNSSLFQLVHLKRLNLAENDFNNSLIPPGLRHLSRLTNLNLSAASFFGDIPLEILELSDLVSLDLSENDLGSLLPGLRCMVQNLTKLKELHLGPTHISSTVPETLLNLSLTSLHLERCDLRGKFPIGIFYLSNSQSIDLGYNGLLSGSIPEFNQSSHLESLEFSGTSFSGKLSNLIGNLKSLQHFGVGQCNFFGPIPSSFGNLVQLISLDLSSNRLGGEFPKEIFYLPNLQNLKLSNNENLSGSLPKFDRTYPLEILDLNGISFFGKLPHSIGNLTQLVTLNLAENSFHGSIPESISRLLNLHVLRLGSNYFNGIIEFDLFLKSKNLIALDLSYNEISLLTKPYKNATFPKLEELELSLCHLREFPNFLRNQDQLWNLNLKQNEIHGQVPFWLGGLFELKVLILRSNRFYGAIRNPNNYFDFPSLQVIDLSNNGTIGQLPFQYFKTWKAMQVHNENELMYLQVCTKYVYIYTMTITNKGNKMVYEKILNIFVAIDLSNNRFEGEISKIIGHLKGLKLLNLSNNFLIGHIPSSLGNLTELESLDLSQNKLFGMIPLEIVQLNFLEFLNVSHNHLIGPIPFGKQLDTFSNDSFIDNPGLCGNPLSKKCENFEHPYLPPSTFGDN